LPTDEKVRSLAFFPFIVCMSYHRYLSRKPAQSNKPLHSLFVSLRMRLDRIEDSGVTRATAQISVQPNFSFF